MKCPLCLSQKNTLYDQDKRRIYYLCQDCELIFVSRSEILPAIDELKRYEAHQNDENDPHYQNYLQKILNSSLSHLPPQSRGLDFGCGKTILLSSLYIEAGFLMDSYDVFFHPYEEIWQKKYDFIIMSEVIEHLASPREVMDQLKQLLTQKGQILVKTKFHPEEVSAFRNWFYRRDLTHVQFFNKKSFSRLAQQLNLSEPILLSEDLYLFSAQ